MLVYAFVLILGLNPGVVPCMGPHPVVHAPVGSCLIYVEHPIKLLKRIKINVIYLQHNLTFLFFAFLINVHILLG